MVALFESHVAMRQMTSSRLSRGDKEIHTASSTSRERGEGVQGRSMIPVNLLMYNMRLRVEPKERQTRFDVRNPLVHLGMARSTSFGTRSALSGVWGLHKWYAVIACLRRITARIDLWHNQLPSFSAPLRAYRFHEFTESKHQRCPRLYCNNSRRWPHTQRASSKTCCPRRT